jgi:large subunit ribosomal protein L25
MPEVLLHAEAGRTIGSRPSRRLRMDGKIPGVVYGHGTDPLPVSVGAREFQVALSGEAGLNTLLSLQVDGTNYLTLARAIQRHPSRNVVTHVDFQIVRRDEVISAEVGINLVGEALEVAHGDGVVEQQLFTLVLKAKPADIPPSLELDISGLEIGTSLHVSDLTLPAGVELETDPEATVVTGQPPRVVAAEGEGEGAEGAEGEEGAEGAEGAGAPAAGGEESATGSSDSGESSEG